MRLVPPPFPNPVMTMPWYIALPWWCLTVTMWAVIALVIGVVYLITIIVGAYRR